MYFIDEFDKELKKLGIIINSACEISVNLIGQNKNRFKQIYCPASCAPSEFAKYIYNYSWNIKFHPLILQKHLVKSELHRKGEIFVRYQEWYKPLSDDIEKVYDVLIEIL